MRGLFAYHLLCLGLVFVHCDPIKYDLTEHCGGQINVSSSAILNVKSWSGGDECKVTVYSNFHMEETDRLRLELRSPLKVSCGARDYLRLFEDEKATSPLSGRICGSITNMQTMYISYDENFLVVTFHSSNMIGDQFSAQFLATATSRTSGPGSEDFVCDNNFNIKSSLECDGDNNCGDRSDERSALCDAISKPVKIGLIAGMSTFSLFVGVTVIVVLVKSRQFRRQQYQSLVNSYASVAQESPTYGSVQGGNSTGNTAPPPPYTAKNTTVPSSSSPPPYHLCPNEIKPPYPPPPSSQSVSVARPPSPQASSASQAASETTGSATTTTTEATTTAANTDTAAPSASMSADKSP